MKRGFGIAGLCCVLTIASPFVALAVGGQRPATKAEVNLVVEGLRHRLKDPYSVRDAAISNVGSYDAAMGQSGSYICFRLNAKNQFGAYTGVKTVLAVLKPDGTLGGSGGWLSPRDLCQQVTFRPFTELNRLKAL